MEVRNICFDPKRHRDAWEKRRWDPAVAYECAWVVIQGTKEPRPFGGGVLWTVEARYEEFANFVESGMEAGRRAVFLRERALHGRAMRVFLVPHGRGWPGCCLRRNVLFTSKQKKVCPPVRQIHLPDFFCGGLGYSNTKNAALALPARRPEHAVGCCQQ